MNTARMTYFTNASVADAGKYLKSSTVYDDEVESNCLELSVFGMEYNKKFIDPKDLGSISFSDSIDQGCKNCKKLSEDFCELCEKFPNPGANLISCIGYDDLTDTVALIGNNFD
eukprot:Awhi_evm2s2895